MTTAQDRRRPPGATRLRRARTRLTRRASRPETRIAGALAVLALVVTVAVAAAPNTMPFTTLIVPLVLGSILLGPRTLPWFVGFVVLLLAISLLQQDELTGRVLAAAGVQFVVAMIVLLASLRRSRLGVAGLRGESMFVDLRDRILNQGGGVPELPEGWHVESALHSAGGTAFAGDFLVSTRSPCGRSLEVVVVDVSGKGEEAGTRALLLSGALGGLLGALPPPGFLPAANEYLVRQAWVEGFATAVHLSLDVETGEFEIRTAGHPPAAHRRTGVGEDETWRLLPSEGPVLGLVAGAEFTGVSGTLEVGESLLLYTDGMVEEPRRDLEVGIDLMLGEADAILDDRIEGAADRLVGRVGSIEDDRAVLLVHRS